MSERRIIERILLIKGVNSDHSEQANCNTQM